MSDPGWKPGKIWATPLSLCDSHHKKPRRHGDDGFREDSRIVDIVGFLSLFVKTQYSGRSRDFRRFALSPFRAHVIAIARNSENAMNVKFSAPNHILRALRVSVVI